MSELKRLQDFAERLIQDAQEHGFVVTISTEPGQPLRMGNHKMVAEVREAHSKYRGQEKLIRIQNAGSTCMRSVCDDYCAFPACVGEEDE